jgi:hypothetical protein
MIRRARPDPDLISDLPARPVPPTAVTDQEQEIAVRDANWT